MSAVSSALDGHWKLIRSEHNGEAAPSLVSRETELILHEGTYEVKFAGTMVDGGTFKLGTSAKVGVLELHGTQGENAGRTIPGIYQRVGERLRICYGLDGETPAGFIAAVGQHRYLASYARI